MAGRGERGAERKGSRAIPVVVAVLVGVLVAVGLLHSAQDRLWMLALSAGLGLLAWLMRSATPAGAVMGSLLTAAMLITPDKAGLLGWPLMALVVLTVGATRFGRKRKERLGLAESKHGRNAGQIAANLGAAALAAGLVRDIDFCLIAAVAALVEATADTLSSEIGQVFGGPTVMVTTLRRVAPGTDGGVSLIGSGAGVAGATAVALVALTAGLDVRSAGVALVAGLVGWTLDSVLGATVEPLGWLSNDGVNFTSTSIAGLTGMWLGRIVHPNWVLPPGWVR